MNEPVHDSTSADRNAAFQRSASQQSASRTLTRGLGWMSIALGAMELLAPRVTAQASGTRSHKRVVQAYGVREIITGIGLLTSRDPKAWLIARLGGDALDLATLATDLNGTNERKRRVAMSLVAVLGITALDVLAANEARKDAEAAKAAAPDYGDRVGMALSPDEMRGTARDALSIPADMQTPSALRPYVLH